ERVRHDEELHHVVVDRARRRLDDERVDAANVLVDLAERLTIAEALNLYLAERGLEVIRDRGRKRGVCVAGEEADLFEHRGSSFDGRRRGTESPHNPASFQG